MKCADIYIQGYEDVPELRRGLSGFFTFSNGQRVHQSLGDRIPAAVYLRDHGAAGAVAAGESGIIWM